MKKFASAAPLLLALGAGSCTKTDPLAPPNIALDQTECDECGMIVSDERYACAIIVRVDADVTEPRVFDDINCLVLHEFTEPDPLFVNARWVHDHATRAWVRAENAHYVWDKQLNTPMMSHLAAFSEKTDAEAFRKLSDGQAMTFDDVQREYTPVVNEIDSASE